jgi:hypothetical protein
MLIEYKADIISLNLTWSRHDIAEILLIWHSTTMIPSEICQISKVYLSLTFDILDWVAQTSIQFKSQLNLKCKSILYMFKVNLSVS